MLHTSVQQDAFRFFRWHMEALCMFCKQFMLLPNPITLPANMPVMFNRSNTVWRHCSYICTLSTWKPIVAELLLLYGIFLMTIWETSVFIA